MTFWISRLFIRKATLLPWATIFQWQLSNFVQALFDNMENCQPRIFWRQWQNCISAVHQALVFAEIFIPQTMDKSDKYYGHPAHHQFQFYKGDLPNFLLVAQARGTPNVLGAQSRLLNKKKSKKPRTWWKQIVDWRECDRGIHRHTTWFNRFDLGKRKKSALSMPLLLTIPQSYDIFEGVFGAF